MLTEEKKHHFKKKLEEEKRQIEAELQDVGAKNAAGEWDPALKSTDIDSAATEPDEIADRGEELVSHRAIVERLQKRLLIVERALAKMDTGEYGISEISGEEIEEERLEANPAARTGEKDKEKEKDLPL